MQCTRRLLVGQHVLEQATRRGTKRFGSTVFVLNRLQVIQALSVFLADLQVTPTPPPPPHPHPHPTPTPPPHPTPVRAFLLRSLDRISGPNVEQMLLGAAIVVLTTTTINILPGGVSKSGATFVGSSAWGKKEIPCTPSEHPIQSNH